MIYKSYQDAVVALVLQMELIGGEVVEFAVEGFPRQEDTLNHRITFQDKGGEELFPKTETKQFDGRWVLDTHLNDAYLAILFVRRAREEGFWLKS